MVFSRFFSSRIHPVGMISRRMFYNNMVLIRVVSECCLSKELNSI